MPTPPPTSSARPSTGLASSSLAPHSSAAPTLTLAVQPGGGITSFFSDLGTYALSGTTTGLPDAMSIEVYRRRGTGSWGKVATTTVTANGYRANVPEQAAGTYTFEATTGGAPGSGDEADSNPVRVVVAQSRIVLDKPPAKVDSLTNPRITGHITPARTGVGVHVDVLVGTRYRLTTTARTDRAGHFGASFRYGQGRLASYRLRTAYHAVNRDRWEISGSRTIQRVAVLHAVVTRTTGAEVAKTYHPGCPVGPSKLRTITMNFYGWDGRMHRGVLIIRSDLTGKIIRGFGSALAHRYPVAKLNNPNVYGGNDPRQMAADNTSGFNCRKVVGNPYAQSPHSYGIALDVNTVQNPYRDVHGKWWPSNGRSYINRSHHRKGMLFLHSSLTASLRRDHFFWGGLWAPDRDYQHFEYR